MINKNFNMEDDNKFSHIKSVQSSQERKRDRQDRDGIKKDRDRELVQLQMPAKIKKKKI